MASETQVQRKYLPRWMVDLLVAILGPMQSGKTMMLGALQKAVEQALGPHSLEGHSSDFMRRSYHVDKVVGMTGLQDNVVDALDPDTDDELEATREIDEYDFTFNFASSETEQFAAFGEKVPLRVRTYDEPGDLIFPKDKKESLVTFGGHRIQDLLRRSRALLLCVPSDGQGDDAYRRNFAKLLQQIKGRRRSLPFRKVVILLTRADELVYRHKRDARDMLLQMDPLEHLRETVLKFTGPALDNHLHRRAEIVCGFTSAHGFLKTGEPNSNTKTGKLRVMEAWRPFGLFEPWKYIITGEPGNLKRVDRTVIAKNGG